MNLGSNIEFNKSSLLSLKAELARKHEEANHAKAFGKTKPSKPLAKPPKSVRHNSGQNIDNVEEDENFDDCPKPDELHSSRVALEAKAKLYKKLSENPGNSAEDSSFLVDFSKKTDGPVRPKASNDEEDEDAKRVETDSDEYDAPSDPEDDWVEYKDCLGRTRRCLRRDLPELKAQDAQLYESTKRDSPPPPRPLPADDQPSVPLGCAAPDLFSDDMRREQQRQKWAEEEERVRNKSDVHYQDVLFNEARQHGVGYFAFSTDDAERRAQQTALKNLRSETEKQQAATNAARQRRADLLSKRLRAAHNRKRAREGLPPLAEDEELPQSGRPESPPPEPEPPQIHLAADPDKRGQRERPPPTVRPWDIGKEGVTQRPVMTQDEWVSQKRKERHREFAPPSFYEDRNPSGASRSAATTSHAEDFDEYEEPKGLYFTSKRKKKNREEPNRRPMQEVEDFTGEEDLSEIPIPKAKAPSRKGVEIPPPPTMEYFGPSDKTLEASKRHSNASSRVTAEELESSITAGLSFLRKQHEERQKLREKGMLDIV